MGKNQDPGPGINIPDPPHCFQVFIHSYSTSRYSYTHTPLPGLYTLILHFQVFIYLYPTYRFSYDHIHHCQVFIHTPLPGLHTLISVLLFQVLIRSHRSLPVFIHAHTPLPGLHTVIQWARKAYVARKVYAATLV
jgi:hypothetical protein